MARRLPLRVMLVLLLSSAPPALAATYYISPGGDDHNPGSQALPWATLENGHSHAQPGDTLYLRGGTYRIDVGVAFTASGSVGAPIQLLAFPGETPVLDGSGITTLDTWVLRLGGDRLLVAHPKVGDPKQPAGRGHFGE